MFRALPVIALAATACFAGVPADAAPAGVEAKSTVRVTKFKNCAALNKAYPHGVGRPGAKDKTSSTPVRNFTVHAKLYAAQPRTLDRDRDGIACEKR